MGVPCLKQKEIMKLYYQPLGTATYIGMQSKNEEEIIQQFYSFWNHGATGGKLHWMSETFAYISTNEKKLEKYFENSSYHLLLNNYPDKYEGKEESKEFKSAVKKLAQKRLEELKENKEAFRSTDQAVFDYSLGKTEAKEINAQVKCFDEEEYKQKMYQHNTGQQHEARSNFDKIVDGGYGLTSKGGGTH
tara:strand:+ start:324 stop:893 length:570 start_codon:yes stop_codon:yes gene_type:complete